jgi:hypothetical protein
MVDSGDLHLLKCLKGDVRRGMGYFVVPDLLRDPLAE